MPPVNDVDKQPRLLFAVELPTVMWLRANHIRSASSLATFVVAWLRFHGSPTLAQ
jgi:hypothetical protein